MLQHLTAGQLAMMLASLQLFRLPDCQHQIVHFAVKAASYFVSPCGFISGIVSTVLRTSPGYYTKIEDTAGHHHCCR